MHFWIGSLCYCQEKDKTLFPIHVVAVSDIVTIISDMGNKIPDKSWMLYLLELFNRQRIPVELNLICSFNDDGKFHAIFGGVNKYEFKQIRPIVEHSYLRQIVMNQKNSSIIYLLTDITLQTTERFELSIDESGFIFEGADSFTGVEWHNRIGNSPYEIRYHVEVSQILYGRNDSPEEPESISYFPYNRLIPNKNEGTKEFPISFHQDMEKNGCLCYKIGPGICNNGMEYSF